MSRREYDAIAQPTSNLPHIRIDFGNNQVLLGTEQNRHVNVIQTKENSLFFAGNWFVGDHTIKFGVDYAENDIFNYYGRNQNGYYRFTSLANFIAGNPSEYDYRAPLPGGSYADIPAEFTIKNTGFFLQDTWAINYNLSLLFGLRGDKPSFGGEPIYNECILVGSQCGRHRSRQLPIRWIRLRQPPVDRRHPVAAACRLQLHFRQ